MIDYLTYNHTLFNPIFTMANTPPITSRAPEWAAQATDAAEDVDEPPEKLPTTTFKRSTVNRPVGQPSLLTRAILAQSDEETIGHSTTFSSHRRRSMASNISVASTADLTSDTGFTSPSRTSTPSPPIPDISVLRLHPAIAANKPPTFLNNLTTALSAQEPAKEAPRKRCIQFACAAKPNPQPQAALAAPPMVKTTSARETPRRPCIKFACQQARPASTQNTPPRSITQPTLPSKVEPSTPKKASVLSATPMTARPSPNRILSNKGAMTRPRFLRATSTDLIKDGSQFHEFASDTAREDDWIRNDNSTITTKLTINDTLSKENNIRRLANEVEEEAQLEEEEAEEALDDDDDEEDEEDEEEDDGEDDDDDDDDDDGDDEDDNNGVDIDDYEAEEDDSDGYHTDEETGFADSDEEDEEDENMVMWTPGRGASIRNSGVRLTRRLSIEQHSDSSVASKRSVRRAKARPIGPTAEATDLPDSTDFVCGTLDEDRPLEEVFLSCLAARRTENLRIIPQDIDPSFPADDLDEEDEEDAYNATHHDSDQNVWVMEDLHHDQDRSRRRKTDHTSPRRFRSPPPTKRHQSPPPPKARGRSPKLLFDRQSPRRVRSPAPKVMTTPSQTPRQGAHIKFHLAGRPGLTQTKSLPRPAALFRHPKQQQKTSKASSDNDAHVRGAIDIVKGLEKKRQRRKEKFMQKYCNRARRGQIPERKTLPGLGAERMKEVGLIMAGKKDQGNYVLSF